MLDRERKAEGEAAARVYGRFPALESEQVPHEKRDVLVSELFQSKQL